MGSLVEARLGADDALAWLVSQPQAKLAVDLCLVGRVRVCGERPGCRRAW